LTGEEAASLRAASELVPPAPAPGRSAAAGAFSTVDGSLHRMPRRTSKAERDRQAIIEARERRERATTAQRAATEALIAACTKARDANIPMWEIARLAGLSRDGLYKLLARHDESL
jgi:hypothetical protein